MDTQGLKALAGQIANNEHRVSAAFEFEMSARNADVVTTSYQESISGEPSFNFFQAVYVYAYILAEVGLSHYRNNGTMPLDADDLVFAIRVKRLFDALEALGYTPNDAPNVKAAIGPHPTDPNKAIFRCEI